MARGFVYRGDKRTSEDMSRKQSEGSRDYDSYIKGGLKGFKPKEGENCIRILPSTWDEPDWDYVIHLHYDVGPDNTRYLCLEKMKDKPCPVCDARAEAADDDERDKLNVAKGAICWVIDRDAEKEGPQLWTIPFTKIRNEVYSRSIDKKSREPILVDHPEEGYDVVFNRKGTGTTTQYSGVEVVRDPSPIHENEKHQQRWLDYIEEHPLPDCLNFFDAEHIEKVLFGRASSRRDRAGAADEEVSSRPSSRRRLAQEDEADAEAAPSRTSRRAGRAPVEEDQEAPSSSRRRPPAKDEEVPTSSRAARRAALLDDDIPFDPETGEVLEKEAPAPRRRQLPKEEDEDAPVATARRSLERLKPRR